MHPTQCGGRIYPESKPGARERVKVINLIDFQESVDEMRKLQEGNLPQIFASPDEYGSQVATTAGKKIISVVDGDDDVIRKAVPARKKTGKGHRVDCRYRASEEDMKASDLHFKKERYARKTVTKAGNANTLKSAKDVVGGSDAVSEGK